MVGEKFSCRRRESSQNKLFAINILRRGDALGDHAHSRSFEDVAKPQLDTKLLVNASDDARRKQGVAAEREKVVGRAYSFDAEKVRPDLRDLSLMTFRRCSEG